MNKVVQLISIFLFAISLSAMESASAEDDSKTIKLPLNVVPRLNPATADKLLTAVQYYRIEDGTAVADEIIFECFSPNQPMELETSIYALVTIKDNAIENISFTHIEPKQRITFAKTLITAEKSLSNNRLWQTLNAHSSSETYDFLRTYFDHQDSLKTESKAIFLLDEETQSQASTDMANRAQLEGTENLRSLISMIPSSLVDSYDTKGYVTNRTAAINCTGSSNQRVQMAVLNKNGAELLAAIEVIVDEMLAIISDYDVEYGHFLKEACMLPGSRFDPTATSETNRSRTRGCVLF